MKKIITIACLIPALSFAAQSTQITGAGSSFIYPVMAKWSDKYYKDTKIKVNYQPIGSGGGISQLTNKTVDFAASDQPQSKSVLITNKWQQFPAIIGGIVPVVHIDGVKNNQLVLSGPVLAQIYSGKITHWDDSAIASLNKKLKLPHTRIISVHRADGSGTTFNFTNYLSSVDKTWRDSTGYNTVVQWPSFGLGAKGNAGVAAQVKNLNNTIGYVEYAFAHSNNLSIAKMQNKSGNIVTANINSFAAAAKNAKWQAKNDFYLVLSNESGKQSWPIVATTFVLLPKEKSAARQHSLQFFKWIFKNGAKMATDLDYVSIPGSVTKQILQYTAMQQAK
jgi:phosphate transport system substrate-binding protein